MFFSTDTFICSVYINPALGLWPITSGSINPLCSGHPRIRPSSATAQFFHFYRLSLSVLKPAADNSLISLFSPAHMPYLATTTSYRRTGLQGVDACCGGSLSYRRSTPTWLELRLRVHSLRVELAVAVFRCSIHCWQELRLCVHSLGVEIAVAVFRPPIR
jgi:hypothetical protein